MIVYIINQPPDFKGERRKILCRVRQAKTSGEKRQYFWKYQKGIDSKQRKAKTQYQRRYREKDLVRLQIRSQKNYLRL